MARTARQSKILELIKQKEIETQEDLAKELRALNFEITQATISRDIKELGLIKIMTSSKRYKYAYVEATSSTVTSKYNNVLKELVINIEIVNNTVVCKTLKDMASAVSSIIDKLNYEIIFGTVYGFDTVMVICLTNEAAIIAYNKLKELID
ncbi:MAG: arginine repressor [Clostridia bacterium]|nr:arginine repressor [Clostridia bacterium]